MVISGKDYSRNDSWETSRHIDFLNHLPITRIVQDQGAFIGARCENWQLWMHRATQERYVTKGCL
jgi:hypothetical protein